MSDSAPSPAHVAVLDERRKALSTQLHPIIGEGRPFLWEVGSGHGHFLTAYAEAHPEKLCIGIDLVNERVERALRKRDRARLPNLHFIRAEARLFLQVLPAAPCLSEVFILFPDPWPKSRHHKHRVLQPGFLHATAEHAMPGCRLYFRTDHHPYFTHAEATVRSAPDWEVLAAAWPFEFETVFQQRAPRHDSLVAQVRKRPS